MVTAACLVAFTMLAGTGCINDPVIILNESESGSAPPGAGDVTMDGTDSGSALESGTPGSDPGPAPVPCAPGAGAVCCGAVVCVGCSPTKAGDCKECLQTCTAGQLCCKRGGPPRCKAVTETCDG